MARGTTWYKDIKAFVRVADEGIDAIIAATWGLTVATRGLTTVLYLCVPRDMHIVSKSCMSVNWGCASTLQPEIGPLPFSKLLNNTTTIISEDCFDTR